MIFENPLAEVIRGSFRQWGSTNPTYKSTYKKITEASLRLADIALGELDVYAPGHLWTWYTHNHMRFYKIKNVDVRLTIELLQFFLADYAHGRLKQQQPEGSEEVRRSASDRSPGSNKARRLPIV